MSSDSEALLLRNSQNYDKKANEFHMRFVFIFQVKEYFFETQKNKSILMDKQTYICI